MPLPLVVPLRLLVAGWHRWAPPFVGGCLWPPSLSYLTRLTPSTSQLAHLRFIATAPSPPTRSMVVMLPVCLPPPFNQLLCLSLCPSTCWLLRGIVGPLHLLVVASGLPPSPITHAHLTPSASQLGAYALYCNRTVAPHSINGCHVARLPASAFQPAPLPLVVPLHLLVVAWHRWAPPFVGCCLWPPSLSHYTRLRLLAAAAAAGGCCRELLPPKPRPRPPPAIVIAIPPSPAILIAFPPSSPHRPGSG